MKQSRLKSPVFWGALAGIILLALKSLGLEADAAAGSEIAGRIFEVICAAMAIFGVANNPTEKNKF